MIYIIFHLYYNIFYDTYCVPKDYDKHGSELHQTALNINCKIANNQTTTGIVWDFFVAEKQLASFVQKI